MLYFIVFLSHLLLLYLILHRDTQSIFLFSVIAIIVYLLNDNMIFVLIIPTILITVLMLINKSTEGLENKKVDETENKKVGETENKKGERLPKIEKLNIKKMKYNKEKTEMIKDLLPLSNALEKIDIDQINTMVTNLNKFIERF